ncbi:hypothetical protein HU200_000124 [Digitaria exilis]|uniref:Uncharacterized protein n=1 Tax=Digitaria exilis TaxID=1010633 RepID=A0A835L1C0_9POAL|nr:hypothetical protein HU200_000124 [Digitaria exilis]CAB3467381.1 unnamed protein product [Digitaria exilis]CAB3469899.1 unnamed protein product [Digitaria exilis]
MGNSVSVAVPVLCVAISALELAILLDPQRTPSGTQQAPPPLRGAIWAFLPLPAVGALFASVALVYLHFYRAAAATAAGHRRLPELVVFMLCASVAFLHFFLFVQEAPAPGGVDYGHEAARELGLAALRALPAAATASFFLGMMLIIVGHIRAGGEGGGGAVAVAGHGPIEAPVVGILVKVASAMAAALVLLMGMAVLFR